MTRRKGRKQRWTSACEGLQNVLITGVVLQKAWREALEELIELQGEYQNRLDSLPPNLKQSKLAAELETITKLPLAQLNRPQDELITALTMLVEQMRTTKLPDAFKRKENSDGTSTPTRRPRSPGGQSVA